MKSKVDSWENPLPSCLLKWKMRKWERKRAFKGNGSWVDPWIPIPIYSTHLFTKVKGKISKPKLVGTNYIFKKKNKEIEEISLPNKISLMKFNATDEECFNLENFEGAYLSLNIVGKCHQNEWMGNVSPQIFIEDYEITGSGKYLF